MVTEQQLKGLTPQQVEESRAKHGVNILTPPQNHLYGPNFLRTSKTR